MTKNFETKNFTNDTSALSSMANFVTGFTDGEGSFKLKVRKKKNCSTG